MGCPESKIIKQETAVMNLHSFSLMNDIEGDSLPENLPPVFDAHVHFFPDALFSSVWNWFDHYGWPIRYKLTSEEIIQFYEEKGVTGILGLHYAHKPGMARELNRYMARLSKKHPMVTGTATVFPGENDAGEILKEGKELGLAGIKLHAHVQCFDLSGKAFLHVCETAAKLDMPLVLHGGREPKSPAYACDPYAMCDAGKIKTVLDRFPELKMVMCHLGADEYKAYHRMAFDHENLWLDTAMIFSDYLPFDLPVPIKNWRLDRIIYGTDFPNIPYAWDREIKALRTMELSGEDMAMIFRENAKSLFIKG